MGMNHIGEIEHLTKIAQPDIAIITTIVPVHMEFMSNIDTIVKAKAEIFKGLQSNGIAILNKENQYYDKLVEYAKNEGVKNIISIGTENGDLFIKKYSLDKKSPLFNGSIYDILTRYIPIWNFLFDRICPCILFFVFHLKEKIFS